MRRLVISRTKGLLRLRNLSYRMQVWHEYHYQATRIKNMEHAERYRTWLLGRSYAFRRLCFNFLAATCGVCPGARPDMRH